MQRVRVGGCVRVREESARGALGHVGVCWHSPLSFLSWVRLLLQRVFLPPAQELYVCPVLCVTGVVLHEPLPVKAVREAQTSAGVCLRFTALG